MIVVVETWIGGGHFMREFTDVLDNIWTAFK